ncbi:hypothetical protein F3J44_02520 [Pantoea sp. Tr-811]|nr:hypothetical protein [Pantoea sp. Tr-811]
MTTSSRSPKRSPLFNDNPGAMCRSGLAPRSRRLGA